jgi:23S rRNA (guanosine2251-2'-O)-methyltransferase
MFASSMCQRNAIERLSGASNVFKGLPNNREGPQPAVRLWVKLPPMYENLITLYGRKPVLEVLSDPQVQVFRLHLADSNADSDIMEKISALAEERGIDVRYHSKRELSRISKNGKQDQGVAIDIESAGYRSVVEVPEEPMELIALDRITNPQNLGMIIRSIAASPCHGLLLPRKGCAKIDPLVHKASAGTLFKTNIYYCNELSEGISRLQDSGFEVVGLSGDGNISLESIPVSKNGRRLFILGNETEGLSEAVIAACDSLAAIPLNNGVESLNVATAATLVAFRSLFAGSA